MKTQPFAIAAYGLLTFALLSAPSFQARACDDDDAHASKASSHHEPTFALTESGPHNAVFQVKGIMCRSCETKVKAALSKVEGVKSVTFLKAGSKDGIRIAQVTFKAGSQVASTALAQAVEGAGFKTTLTQ